jgi:HEAT repeat protein
VTDAPSPASSWLPEALLDVVQDPFRDPVPSLLTALEEDDVLVREEAVRYLKEIRSVRSVGSLIARLRHDAEASVRWEAAEALALLGDVRAVPALVEATRDPDELVRLCAAEALGAIGKDTADVLSALMLLLDDPSMLVRLYAVEAVGYLGSRAVIPLLRTRLAGEAPAVRVWYGFTLWRLGEPFAFEEVRAVLRRGGYTARLLAATVLRLAATDVNVERVVSALRRARDRERHPTVREHLERQIADLAG